MNFYDFIDGRPIIHQGPPCGQCGEMVIGQVLNALGKSYHPGIHFIYNYSQEFLRTFPLYSL